MKRRGGGCRISDLHVKDASLVTALWRSLPQLAAAVKDDRKLTRKNLRTNFDRWHEHFDKARALMPALADHQGSTPRLAGLLPAETDRMSDRSLDNTTTQIQGADRSPSTAWGDSVETLFSQHVLGGRLRTLFAPIEGQVETASGFVQSRSQFNNFLSSPEFQLK